MRVKLIAVDMDGTLLDEDHVTIPPRNISALKAARARGVKIAVATGRTWSLIHRAVEPLGGLDYAVISNGAAVREVSTGQWVSQNCFTNAQAVDMIRCLVKRNIIFQVYCQGQNYVLAETVRNFPQDLFLSEAFVRLFRQTSVIVEDLEQALAGREAEKFDLLYVPPHLVDELGRALAAVAPVDVAKSLENNLEFTPLGVNKGMALKTLADSLGLTADQVMAFGDASNDLEMLQWAGWSFAMENGIPAAKSAARRIAPLNTQGGVGQMVEKYVLTD